MSLVLGLPTKPNELSSVRERKRLNLGQVPSNVFFLPGLTEENESTTENPVNREIPVTCITETTTVSTTTTRSTTTSNTTTSTTTATPVPATTSVTTTTARPIPKPKITTKVQVRLCLLHGICDMGKIEEYFATSTVAPPEGSYLAMTTEAPITITRSPRTTTASTQAPTRQPKVVNQIILHQIERCIQTPEFCNTNLIPMHEKRPESTEAPEITTSTTTVRPMRPRTTDRLSPADYARECVRTGSCPTFGFQGDEALEPKEPAVVDRSRTTLDQQVRLCLFHGIC